MEKVVKSAMKRKMELTQSVGTRRLRGTWWITWPIVRPYCNITKQIFSSKDCIKELDQNLI